MKPMNDFIFVRKLKKEPTSAGGIFLGEQAYDEGEVVAVGPGRVDKKGRRESMWGIAPGDKIVFSPNGNWQQKVGGEHLTVIRLNSVIGEREAA